MGSGRRFAWLPRRDSLVERSADKLREREKERLSGQSDAIYKW